MNLLAVLSQVFDPLAKTIDAVHTSTAEKMEAHRKLIEAQNTIFVHVLEYEKSQLEAQARIIEAEAKGQGILQRNWRPVTMLVFLALVVCDSFGWLVNPLAPEAWTLLQLGLGGYVVGRSAEKIVKNYAGKSE